MLSAMKPPRAALGLCALVMTAAAPRAEAEIYAVAIGVDAYRSLAPLSGAANDARDLAGALGGLGATVETLIDGAATRAAVIAAVERAVARTGPGDMFVLTYAGHGAQEPEALPGDEADGMDETILLAGFARTGPAAGERLRDNEIGALLARLDPGARALVVVDSCHSGTMTRAADRRGARLTTRFGGIGRIGDDPLPPPPAASRGMDLGGGANVIFVAAARDDERISEIEIGGAMRGAVSWTVARALEGAGGFGGPGMSLGDFSSFVRAPARALTASRQTPSVTYQRAGIARDEAVVPKTALAGVRLRPPPPSPTGDDRPPLVFAEAGSGGDLAGAGTWTGDRAAADLIWDAGRGELIDNAGADLIAEARDAGDLRGALRKWRAARRLTAWADRRHAELAVTPGDGGHRIGALVGVAVARPADRAAYLTIANLASDGRVQPVFPDPARVASGADLIAPGAGFERLGEVPVTSPAGADHVVAILSARPPTRLRAWLEAPGDAAAFLTLLQDMAASGDHRIGVTPIFTAP